MRGGADLVMTYPRTAVVVGLAMTVLLGFAARQVRIEAALGSLLPADDPGVRYYDEVRAAFGSDDIAVVGVRTDTLFDPATLTAIALVTDQLAAIDGVERVLSLTNTVDPAADVFDPPPLLPRMPPTAADIVALKAKLAATPLYAQNLVAPDGRGAAINVVLRPMSDAEYAEKGIDERVAAILAAQTDPGQQWMYTGVSRITRSAVTLIRRDLARFTPIAVACVAAVLWFAFRRIRAVVLPLVTVTMAVVWTFGIMAALGIPISLGTFMLPPLLFVVGNAQAMRVIAAYYEQLRAGGAEGAVRRGVHQVQAPLLISALTMAVGFGALSVSGIVAVRDLGLMAVLGVLVLTVGALGFLPAALEVWTRTVRVAETAPSPRVESLMVRLGAQAYAARGTVLGIAALIALLAAIGAARIVVESDFLAYFDRDAPVRADHELINQQIVGSNPFYLIVEGGQPGALRRWEVLKLVKELQTFIGTLPGISGSISLVDYLELLETGLNTAGEDDILIDESGKVVEGGGAAQSFWENSANLPPVLNMISASPDTFRAVVNRDFSRASIVVRSRVSGSGEIEAMLGRIREYVARTFPADLRVVPTGSLVLITGTSSSMVLDQIVSVSLALLGIFAVMALMLLSARIGLLAILPNVFAIDVFFGILGWGQLPLNLGTSLIATMALGLAVDSSVHYMWRLSRELAGESEQAAAIQRTLRAVGAPMLYTTLALAVGFLAFAGSSFPPIRHFGVLTAVTLLTAFAANLVVLPALLATTKIITLWDLLRVKLGQDPTRTIPLLAGLRPAQARIVVLMGELRHFPPGAPIVRAGEAGTEMYVILSGTTDVYVRHGFQRRQVAQFRRGDVFGEMALVRNEERSADVEARDEVEALAVDQRFLQRIQRRYPRIAARVLLNLTRILSDRLQRMNERLR